ncbi:hypothetical protein HPB52_011676 [Rhipicephalus sanguineus]|uniref:Uncharacterized protein n=1 Tax=Rhipicephalus sanguineus TaxID=34632 RepID=A0A9D4SQN6_RHISA|nr:hypothetical protein HPB52_011676 [Rhipicephalus sanguineus]
MTEWLDYCASLKHDVGHLTKETHLAFGHTSHALYEISLYCLEELRFRQIYESENKLRLQKVLDLPNLDIIAQPVPAISVESVRWQFGLAVTDADVAKKSSVTPAVTSCSRDELVAKLMEKYLPVKHNDEETSPRHPRRQHKATPGTLSVPLISTGGSMVSSVPVAPAPFKESVQIVVSKVPQTPAETPQQRIQVLPAHDGSVVLHPHGSTLSSMTAPAPSPETD